MVLLQAHYETCREASLAERLEPHARRAVEWMLTEGGLEEHGYLVHPGPGRTGQPELEGLRGCPVLPRRHPGPGAPSWCRKHRATPTTPSCARLNSPMGYGGTSRTHGACAKPPTGCASGSSPTSGCRRPASPPSRWTGRGVRWTPWRRTPGTCSGRGSSIRPAPAGWAGGCWSPTSSRAGRSGPWRPDNGRTTRCPTTGAAHGPTTTPSSPSDRPGTVSSTRCAPSSRASSRRRPATATGCPRSSPATTATRPPDRSRTRTRAHRRPGPPPHRRPCARRWRGSERTGARDRCPAPPQPSGALTASRTAPRRAPARTRPPACPA